MKDKRIFSATHNLGLVLGVAVLGMLTGCVTQVERAQPGEVYEVAPPVQTTVVIEDDYVYYPSYEVYYSSSRHQYAYRDGRNWVSRPAPRGVSVNVLLASPSVRMNFHDSPAQHHAVVTKQYPRNWAPPVKPRDGKEDRTDNRQNDHRDNHGK